MLKNSLTSSFLILLIVLITSLTYADTLTLKSGVVHKGTITTEEDERIQIKLEGSGARLWFPRDQVQSFKRTEPKEDTQENPSAPEENSIAIDDDVARARQLLEKLREQQELENGNKTKPNRNRRNDDSEETGETEQAAEAPALSSEDVDALIDRLRKGKTVYIRRDACIALGETNAEAAIPHLIYALDDDSLLIRKEANKSLIKITDQDFGFRADERHRNVRLSIQKKWEEWYEEVKKEEASEQLKSWF